MVTTELMERMRTMFCLGIRGAFRTRRFRVIMKNTFILIHKFKASSNTYWGSMWFLNINTVHKGRHWFMRLVALSHRRSPDTGFYNLTTLRTLFLSFAKCFLLYEIISAEILEAMKVFSNLKIYALIFKAGIRASCWIGFSESETKEWKAGSIASVVRNGSKISSSPELLLFLRARPPLTEGSLGQVFPQLSPSSWDPSPRAISLVSSGDRAWSSARADDFCLILVSDSKKMWLILFPIQSFQNSNYFSVCNFQNPIFAYDLP